MSFLIYIIVLFCDLYLSLSMSSFSVFLLKTSLLGLLYYKDRITPRQSWLFFPQRYKQKQKSKIRQSWKIYRVNYSHLLLYYPLPIVQLSFYITQQYQFYSSAVMCCYIHIQNNNQYKIYLTITNLLHHLCVSFTH